MTIGRSWLLLQSTKGIYAGCGFEEAYELQSLEDFEKLDLSVPRGEIPEHLYKQTTLTFNPWSEGHWLKSRFFDKPSEDVSTYSTNYLINEFLTDTDRKVFEDLKQRNYRRYKVAGLGEWGIAEGLVYENVEVLDFNVSELGIVRDRSGKVLEDKSWQYKRFFGLDYGYTNDPTAFICFACNPIDKTIWVYDEHYEKGMLNSDIAEMIKKKGLSKERIRADAAEPKSNDDLRRYGIGRVMPSVKGRDSIMNGIVKIQEYRIFVLPSCVNAISEFNSYCYKKERLTEKPLNEPEDHDNHLMDALRYAFYDVQFFRPISPEEEKRRRTEIYRSSAGNIWAEDFV